MGPNIGDGARDDAFGTRQLMEKYAWNYKILNVYGGHYLLNLRADGSWSGYYGSDSSPLSGLMVVYPHKVKGDWTVWRIEGKDHIAVRRRELIDAIDGSIMRTGNDNTIMEDLRRADGPGTGYVLGAEVIRFFDPAAHVIRTEDGHELLPE